MGEKMALTKCKECGTEVSTNAKTCPHCGISNPGLTAKTIFVGVIAFVGIVFLLFKVFGGDSSGSSDTANGTAKKADTAQEIAQIKSQLPKRYYSIQDGTEYGYEQAVSVEAQRQGQVASKVLMFKFLGERENTLQFYGVDGDFVSVFQCIRPCEFVKQMVFFHQRLQRKEHIRAAEGSIVWAITHDAMNGFLQKHTKERDGKLQEVWFDENGPKWRLVTK